MRTPQYDMSVFSERRQNLAGQLKGAALVLVAHPEFVRNNDVHYPFRQDSNLFYMTGFEEPQALFVFRPGMTPETAMFVLPRDPQMETWTGFRYGPEKTKALYKMDATFAVADIEKELPNLLKDVDKIFYSMFINLEVDKLILKFVEQIAQARARTNKGNLAIHDARPLVGEWRLKKSKYEVSMIKKACEVTASAHQDVMRACRAGVNERALEGVFLKAIMGGGCAREGYGSIVASGANATTLHYVFNDQVCRDGDMLLVDAGGEYNFYTADITRTYPVNGRFSPPQKRVYQKVLDLQKSLVEMVKPGQTREGLQKAAIAGLTDIMIDEKLLRGRRDELIEKREFFKFYPHGVGHWLGMDVHDAGVTEINGEPRPLEPGFIMTIEPGLYVPYDAAGIPDELRGLGIRIEDDILVTETSNENLTASCPKEIDELESIIGRA